MTPFGKEIRKLRIDADITLSDMARGIGKTAAYLSAVELGDKPLNETLLNDIVAYLETLPYFKTHGVDAKHLLRLADRSKRSVDIRNLNESEREAVAGFARQLPGLPEEKRDQLTRKVKEWIGNTER